MRAASTLSSAALIGSVIADTHYMFAGYFAGSQITGLTFDDTTNELSVSNNITINTSDGSKWISMDSRKQNLYVCTTGAFQSYAIGTDGGLTFSSNITTPDGCDNANHIVSQTESPYAVFGVVYEIGATGCPTTVISVDDSGALNASIASVEYDSSAGVHGAGLSEDNDFLYSADDSGNGVWVHSYDSTAGTVEEIQHLNATNGSDPRHLAVHPFGSFVYVVYEESSEIAVYSRDNTTGLLAFTNTTYSLLPTGFTNASASYWADECLISIPTVLGDAPKYLIAATRSRTTTLPGYVSAFALDATTGAITSQLFLEETNASGGSANSPTPSIFSEEVFAITDSTANTVDIWKINGTSAASVASVTLASGPANVQWLS